MKKLMLTTVVLGVAAFIAAEAHACPGGGGRAVYQPALAPAPVTTARVDSGYRSFSYQPAPAYRYVPSYGRSYQSPSTGFRDAGAKIRGE